MRKALTALTSLFAVLVTLSLVVGPIWEQLERQRAIRDFPAPGRVIDIGGRHIQLDCRGVGTPAVVFESGLGFSGSLSWTKVQDEVAKFTRACAYSRAGIIWSDDKDGPHDGEGVARDLHAALAGAGESGPFVVTGHSIGGPTSPPIRSSTATRFPDLSTLMLRIRINGTRPRSENHSKRLCW